jgi:dolichol-phosphate mannosyltransferase
LSVYVVMPTYNEAANLPGIVREILALNLPGLRLLVVDDNSPDGTGRLADDLAAADDRVAVLHRPSKQGLGTAYVAGFAWALDHGADTVIQMDADFSHSPTYLPIMLDKIKEFDVVVGSRYVAGGKVDEDWPLWRSFLSWWGSRVYAPAILGLHVHDSTAGFKCLRRQVLEQIGLPQVRSNGYIFQVEIACLCEKHGFRILEIPVYFEDRVRGKSKMSVKVNAEAAWRVWQIKWRYRNLKPASVAVKTAGPDAA